MADLACHREGQRLEIPKTDGIRSGRERRAAWAPRKPGTIRRHNRACCGRDVGQREKWMRAALAHVHAVMTEAPVAFVAGLAAPETLVGPGKTTHAEHAAF